MNNLITESMAYDLMKVSVVICEEFPDMDYEDVWEKAKEIYNSWIAEPHPEYGYIQEYAADICAEEVQHG